MENQSVSAKIPFLILAVLGVVVLGGTGYYFLHTKQAAPTSSPSVTESVQHAGVILPPPIPAQIAMTDYHLFNTPADSSSEYSITYAVTGVIDSGPYKDYHLVVAYNEIGGPEWYVYLFLTKDFKTFVVDTSTTTDPYGYAAQTYADQVSGEFNRAKVVGAESIPFDFPAVIDEGSFALVRNNGVDWNGLTTLASSTPLASNVPSLWFSFQEYNPSIWGSNNMTNAQYHDAENHVSVENAQGLVFDYTLISREGVGYNTENASSTSYRENTVFYKSSDFITSTSTYSSYGELIPGGCGYGGSTWILRSISQNDLVPVVQTKLGVQLYALKNPDNPLNREEYKRKFIDQLGYSPATDAVVSQIDGSTSYEPSMTFEQYAAKNPVLIAKDPWGRWIGLGETDFPAVSGGCGKPVIYLYPQKPTDVTVSFMNPVRFDVDIPTYQNGWSVRANPDGTLNDLQQSATDCRTIDISRPGSEYAGGACETNAYPYLYWAGRVGTPYPVATGGWVIARADVFRFLDEKLTNMGMNEKERGDMESYWVPQLLKEDVPYYRLSFFDTATMNAFIPMRVTPRPDTVFRVFLDWSPLANMPHVVPQPQSLPHLIRNGFTLVEWGGLEQ